MMLGVLWMQAIDGIDNGINLYDTDKLPRYANDTHLSARVGRLNPDWMDEQTPEAEDEAFRKAMSLTGGEFLEVYCLDSLNGPHTIQRLEAIIVAFPSKFSRWYQMLNLFTKSLMKLFKVGEMCTCALW